MHLLITRLLLGLAETCCCWSTETQTVRCTLRKLRLPLLYFTLLYYLISLIVKFSSCLVLSCPVLIVALWRVLDMQPVVLFSCSYVIPVLIRALSCSALLFIPVRPPLWYALCRVLFWSYPCDPHFHIRCVVFSVLITPVWPPLWYTLFLSSPS